MHEFFEWKILLPIEVNSNETPNIMHFQKSTPREKIDKA